MSYSDYSEPYEGPTINMISSEIRTARTQHPCAVCDVPIKPGETYIRDVWTEDGELSVMKRHDKGCVWTDIDNACIF